MSIEKRTRSANFDPNEKMRFLRILQKKGNDIVSKHDWQDVQTNREKDEAWKEIANELNETSNIFRTPYNLKKLWEKLKAEAKLYESLSLGEGNDSDGEPIKIYTNPVLDLVLEITDPANIEPEYEPELFCEKNDTAPDPLAVPTVTQSSELDSNRENSETLSSAPSNNLASAIQHDEDASIAEVNKEKVTGEEHDEHKDQTHSKNNLPIKRRNTKSSRVYRNYTNERLKCEKDKRALLQLQKEHMIEEHALKMKHGELKTRLLEAIIKKLRGKDFYDLHNRLYLKEMRV